MKAPSHRTLAVALTLTLTNLCLTVRAHAQNRVLECEASALQYVLTIANAPYEGESRISEKDLNITSRLSKGDGAEAYQFFQIQRLDSAEIYSVKLYAEGTEICPLEEFKVRYKKN